MAECTGGMGGLLTRDGPRTICLWARVHARWRVAGQRRLGERAISWVRYASARHLCPSHPLRHGAWARAPTRQRRRLEETCRTGTSSAIPGTWGLFGAKATGSAPRRQPRPVHSCKCEDTPSAKRVWRCADHPHDLALPGEAGGHSLSVRDVTARRGRRGGDGDGGGGRDRAGDGHTRAGGSGDLCAQGRAVARRCSPHGRRGVRGGAAGTGVG